MYITPRQRQKNITATIIIALAIPITVIAAYFITALAGGIFGIGIIRHGIRDKKFLRIVENTIILLFIAVIILVVAAILEVYITPNLF